MYAYIENDEVKRQGNLPPTWISKNGNTISGFHLFANQTEADEGGKTGVDILRAEGWLPLVEERPEYDEETHYLTNPTYEILADKVIRRYEVAEIPEVEEVPQEPNEMELLKERLDATEMTLIMLMMEG